KLKQLKYFSSLHHRGCVNAITFNSSGQLIASGSDDRYVAIMDTFTGDLISRYKTGHSLNVFQVMYTYVNTEVHQGMRVSGPVCHSRQSVLH
ncbi:unnamed protein product, partial [Hymenolepis diminuta]|uniref:WD_REPEATS_REGION domain-containing protein n=1 Tax=Hymenolepis diminuta TaxID=6216 RepID=A0A0R3SLA5_HYMDI